MEAAADIRTAIINAGRQILMEERRCVAPPLSAPVCRD
jgi:hypothetical protein